MSDATPSPTSPSITTTADLPDVASPVVKNTTIAEASAKFLASLSEADKTTPVTFESRPRDELGRFVKAETSEPATEAEPATEPVAEAAPEGTAPAPEPEATTEEEAPAEDEAPKHVVTLKGQAERGEADLDLDVGSPEIAERLARLQNDGMRRKDYTERLAALQTRSDDLAEVEAVIQSNPVGFVLREMTPERRLDVGRAILAEHFAELRPEIEHYLTDPSRLYDLRLRARDQADAASVEAKRTVEANRQAARILAATEALVPDGTSEDIRVRFVRDAERDLVEAAHRGVPIAPDALPTLLEHRIRMYGFGAVVEPPKVVKPAVARPVADRTKAITDAAAAKREQERLQKVQVARRNAAAIPPTGRGPVVTQQPLVPKGATIEEATKALLRSTKAASWSDYGTT